MAARHRWCCSSDEQCCLLDVAVRQALDARGRGKGVLASALKWRRRVPLGALRRRLVQPDAMGNLDTLLPLACLRPMLATHVNHLPVSALRNSALDADRPLDGRTVVHAMNNVPSSDPGIAPPAVGSFQ